MYPKLLSIIRAAVLLVAATSLSLIAHAARAQECVPYFGPGAEAPEGTTVIHPGQTEVTLSWEAPTLMNDCEPLESDIDTYHIYMDEAQGLPNTVETVRVPGDQLTVITDVTPGKRFHAMFRACYVLDEIDYCSFWSQNKRVQVAGPPRRVQFNLDFSGGGE